MTIPSRLDVQHWLLKLRIGRETAFRCSHITINWDADEIGLDWFINLLFEGLCPGRTLSIMEFKDTLKPSYLRILPVL